MDSPLNPFSFSTAPGIAKQVFIAFLLATLLLVPLPVAAGFAVFLSHCFANSLRNTYASLRNFAVGLVLLGFLQASLALRTDNLPFEANTQVLWSAITIGVGIYFFTSKSLRVHMLAMEVRSIRW